MTAIAERVARGAELLDGKLPGWDDRVDLAALDLESCTMCVLGQLFALAARERSPDSTGYYTGLTALGIGALAYGFTAAEGETWAELTAEWRRLITARRLARVPAGAAS
jgi:hypothetical protein